MTPTTRFILSLSVLSLVAGCESSSGARPPGDDSLATSAQELADGTPASVGVLVFLNSSSTTVPVLDVDVGLDIRAAQGLVAWRTGPDGIEHTADDRRYITVAQVDAVPYVGPAALARLEWYARGIGLVQMEQDALVGNFNGVDFNLAESRRALAAANTKSATDLQNAGLSPAAVASIVGARPIKHMVALSKLASVDFAALTSLKAYTVTAAEGEPCTGPGICAAGLSCIGRPGDGSSGYGRCRNLTYIPGEGETCSVFAPCQANLVCNGLASGWPDGNCRPAWMAADFTKYADLALPATTAAIESSQAVVGLSTVPEDITVELDVIHTNTSKLVFVLEDPGGETALLWDGPNEGTPPTSIVVNRGIPRDGTINGYWRLRVTNPSGTGTGRLRSWKLKLTSRWD